MAIRLALPLGVLVGMVAPGVVSHNSAAVVGALIAIVVMAVLMAVEVPLILRAARRRRQRLLNHAPPGTRFAAMATSRGWRGAPPFGSPVSLGRSRGLLRIDHVGVSYQVSGAAAETYRWKQVSRVEVKPRTPLTGLLDVITASGLIRQWQVPGLPELIAALEPIGAEAVGPKPD
jgi:hypothetical protein